MCGFYCIAFIEYMLAGKTLLDYTNLFSLNNYKKNNKIEHKCFNNNYVKSRVEDKKNERRIYLLEEINHNDLMSVKYKQTCKYLNYVEHLLISASTITGCVTISTFASLVCVPVGITSSSVWIKICAVTAGIKKYTSVIKKKNHDKIVLLGKDMLNTIEILIYWSSSL